MKTTTLNHEQVLRFAGITEVELGRQPKQKITRTLKSMGMENIKTGGRGTKTTYIFDIPQGFWTTQVLGLKYSATMLAAVQILLDGQADEDGVVLLDKELYKVLAQKQDISPETAKTNMIKAKKALNDLGYILSHESDSMYRVKKELGEDAPYVLGYDALVYNRDLRRKWYEFYNPINESEVEDRKDEKIAKEQKQIIMDSLGITYYKKAHLLAVSKRFYSDVHAAATHFFNENSTMYMDLSAIRDMIVQRQSVYVQYAEESKNMENNMIKEHVALKKKYLKEERELALRIHREHDELENKMIAEADEVTLSISLSF